MSYFDDASLVLIPSGYKASKVYSVKPTDGSGDLTFTRSNDTATRVASNGLIEKVRTNLAQRSDAFDNAYWIKSASSVTANATTNPLDGATNADKLIESATTASHFIYNSTITPAAVNHTYSLYAKAAERTSIQLVSFNGSTDATGVFNLSTGAVTSQTNGIARIESVGSGWYRCSITHTNAYVASANDYWGQIFLVDGSGNTNYAGNGTSGLFIFGAQFEVSDFGATPYIPTTTAAVSVGPVSGLPRLDYLNSTCPKLLLEPQRTNNAPYSEEFNVNTFWAPTNCSITANNSTSPSGALNADTFTTTSTTTECQIRGGFAGITTVPGNVYTVSIYAKKGTANFLRIRNLFVENGTTSGNAWFNLNTGTVGTVESSQTASIVNAGNGWYRCILTATVGTTLTAPFIDIGFSDAQTFFPTSSVNGFLWGAQVELGSYASSYIPTLAASVTRGADACVKTGISSLIGQTQGTIFAEINVAKLLGIQSRYILVISDNTANNRIYIAFSGSSSNILRARIFSGGVQQASINTGTISSLGTYKLALAYNNNDAVLYMNGAQIGTDTSVTIPACSQLNVCTNQAGANPFDDGINQALLFPTRLTNAQLAELTT